MAPVTEACEECTSNCHVMHKRDKNPSPSASATTFFKVMIGDDFSKILYLPQRFTRSVRKKVGKTIELENFNGEKFEVNITKVDGGLALQKGWSKFVSAHDLKVGDLLVFHYVMDKHFVVLMYGNSGCPELRHYQMETKKTNNCDHFSHESSSQPIKRMKEKETNANMPNTQHPLFVSSRPGPSGCNKETVQSPDPMENNANPDKGFCSDDNDDGNGNGNVDIIVSETPVTERRFCLVDNDNGNIEDERSKLDTKVNSVESGGGRKDYVSDSSGCGDEIKSNDFRKKLEKRLLEKRKDNTVMPSETTCSNSSKKRPRDVDVSDKHTETDKKERGTQGSRLHNDGCLSASNGICPRPEATLAKTAKKDHHTSGSRLHNDGCVSPSNRIFHKPDAISTKISKKDPDTSGTKLHNGSHPFSPTGISPKPTAIPANTSKKESITVGSNLHNGSNLPSPVGNSFKPMGKGNEPIKREPTVNHGANGATCSGKNLLLGMNLNAGSNLEATKMAYVNSHAKEFGNNLPEVKVKPEPVDDDDTPLSGSINAFFSAVMSSYHYLELPRYVKLGSVKSSSTVIFLKNGDHRLWAVLYQTKLGLKALTQGWGIFSRETGIQLGDRCVFSPDKDPNVFSIHTTR